MRLRRKSTNMEPYWDLIKRIITESDIVIEVLDARLVEMSRNEKVEEIIKEVGRPVIYVINKSDLVPKDSLKRQIRDLKDIENSEIVFVSTKKKGAGTILLTAIKKVFKKHGKREKPERGKFDPKPQFREAEANIVVGVLGYPNVGKSSIINVLAHKRKTKVSKKAGTTHGIHWIKATNDIKLIDSPGVIPLEDDDEIRYGLIGARDNQRLKNPELVAHAIIKLFIKYNKGAFERYYNIKINDEDSYEIVEKLAEKKGHKLKGNRPDENRTITMIIKNWQDGDLRL